MPRNGSGVYSKPAGTTAVPNTKIESSMFNTLVDDVVSDLNAARPITAGGTGGTSVTTAQTALGLLIGTNVQAYNANLASLSGLTLAADKLPYATGAGAMALTDLTEAGRALIGGADAAAQRTTLELENVAKTSPQISDDADNISEAGLFVLMPSASNLPDSEGVSSAYGAEVVKYDDDNLFVSAVKLASVAKFTRVKYAGVWSDWIKDGPQLVAKWEYSADVANIPFTDLGSWEAIRIETYNVLNIDSYLQIQVSFDNGSTWQTTGYNASVTDAGGNSTGTIAILLSRNAGDMDGHIDLSGLSERAISSGVLRRAGRAMMFGCNCPLGAVNAIKFISSSDFTGGKIKVYGMVRR
ncbi:pyocin knob domain-containing protein [Celeribacter sp. SCSIO 80788]|uniref:pyocin knob domain-containing protein n=1 Tax=Celeribacter sp. SCSIO 80788 TaxID=3117013 RepID=UPI003DA1D2F0